MSELRELIIHILFIMIGFAIAHLLDHVLAVRHDKRIEQGINDLQNHRDEIIGKEGNEA